MRSINLQFSYNGREYNKTLKFDDYEVIANTRAKDNDIDMIETPQETGMPYYDVWFYGDGDEEYNFMVHLHEKTLKFAELLVWGDIIIDSMHKKSEVKVTYKNI